MRFPLLPPLRLTGAMSLRDGALTRRTVAICDGRFVPGAFPAVDLSGYLLMPGIVDPGFAPGPDAPADEAGIAAAGRAAAEAGVTTRCLTLPWGWERAAAPARARAAASAIAARTDTAGTDLRLHLRCDRSMVLAEAALIALAGSGALHLVSFTDRAERAGELENLSAAGLAARADGADRPGDAAPAIPDTAQDLRRQVPRHLCRLAEAFDRAGILYGSADDRSAETREHYSMIGARICLAPAAASVAAAARAVGDPVILSAEHLAPPAAAAPRQRSAALIRAGLGDALMAGALGDSLAAAAFALADAGILPLERAWALISSAPAQILRLPDRGSIAPRKRADLAIIRADTRAVEATIAGGRLTHLAGKAAERFWEIGAAAHLAAE